MSEIGRPTKMTEITLKKLEEGFLNDFTDEQACFFAGISTQTLYTYQKENPDFLERKQLMKENIKMKAKLKVSAVIDSEEDAETAKWYLARKAKNEGFSERTELTGADGKDLPSPIYDSRSTKSV